MAAEVTADVRARERSRLVRLAVVLGGLDRALSVVTSIVRVGLLAYVLSNRDYGLYVAVLGVVATAALLDFGLHYGVVSSVSRALGEDDDRRIRSIVSTGASVYGVISFIALLVALPSFAFGPVGWIFGLAPDQVGLARLIAMIGFGGLLMSLPTKVAGAGLMGLQLSYIVSAYRSVSGVTQTVALAIVAIAFPGKLMPIAIVSASMDLAAGVILTIWAGARHPTRLRLSLRYVDRALVRPLLGTGLTFFVANLANLLRRSLVTVAVAHSLGTAAVPRFSVPLALFITGLAFTDILASSLWPAYGEAAARRDWQWVERTFRLSTRASFLIAFGIAVLGVVCGDEVLKIWTSKIPSPPLAVLAWLAAWLATQAGTSAAAALLNGLDRNRIVMIVVTIEGAVTLALTTVLVRFFGIEGAAAAMALSGAAGAFVLIAFLVPAATDGKVRSEAGTAIRLVPLSLVAVLAGIVVERPFAGVLARLVLGGGVAAAVYAGSVWTLVLTPSERSRVRGWIAGRLGRLAGSSN